MNQKYWSKQISSKKIFSSTIQLDDDEEEAKESRRKYDDFRPRMI